MEFDETKLLKDVKAEIINFLHMHYPRYKISADKVECIAKHLLADLLLISTNEKFFSKYDLINIIKCNIVNCTCFEKKRYIYTKVVLIIVSLIWLYISFKVAKVNLFNLVCVIVSDICILILWALMKYSDYYYWNAPPREAHIYFSSKEYNAECDLLNVIIEMDNILYKQEVWIENIQRSKISYVDGYLEFYSHNRKVYEIHFIQQNIGSGKCIKIDEISADLVKEYFEKAFWNEVYLNITKLKTEDGKEKTWEGIIIDFFRIPNLKPIRYIRIGIVCVLPYEVSWFYENVIEKIWWFDSRLRHASFGGYDLANKWNNIKIKGIGLWKTFFWRSLGWLLLCIIMGIGIVVLVGQVLVIKSVFHNIVEILI